MTDHPSNRPRMKFAIVRVFIGILFFAAACGILAAVAPTILGPVVAALTLSAGLWGMYLTQHFTAGHTS